MINDGRYNMYNSTLFTQNPTSRQGWEVAWEWFLELSYIQNLSLRKEYQMFVKMIGKLKSLSGLLRFL